MRCHTKTNEFMKKIKISTRKYYTPFIGEISELYTVDLDGVEIDCYTTFVEAMHIAKGVGLGLQICGHKVSIDNTVSIPF